MTRSRYVYTEPPKDKKHKHGPDFGIHTESIREMRMATAIAPGVVSAPNGKRVAIIFCVDH